MNYPIPFGKYLLLERVNVGGMAEVFKSKAFGVEGFERILAIKRILPNMADDDEFINMFVDEARIAVQLSHANIVQIYELGKFEGQYYIAMEYVAGKDLRQILDYFRKQKALLPLPAAAFLAAKICEGLDYAHRKTDPTGRPLNVIHRDVSPQNILVSYEGAVKITDFGIAKAEDRASKTQAGVLKGKFGYMSPEQVRGLEIDHRSDIFALGILMYEMMTGKRLFLGESDFSTLEKVRNADVPPPTQHNPSISPELERVLLKSLAKERDERYQWASELHDDLQQFLIENNTIFNAKRLAALMQAEYRTDIEAEMAKMEEFMHAPAPATPEAAAGVEGMRMAPTASRTDPAGAARGEKTMIFESGFGSLSDAPTQIAEDLSAGGGAGGGSEARTGSVIKPSGPSSLRPQPSLAGADPVVAGMQQRHIGAIVIAAAAFISLLILLVVLLTGQSNEVGTIVITSSPTEQVDIYLDGQPIGNRTPMTRSDIPVGEHFLLARATGYADRAYKFELAAGKPAVINIQLQKSDTGPPPGSAGTLEIVSDPPGASIRIGGLPEGVTPKTVQAPDVSRPVIFELTLAGYETVTRTYAFPQGVTAGKILVPLSRAGGSATPPVADASGRILVRSEPPGATVYLGRVKKCVTPCEIDDVDTKTAQTVELNLDNHRPVKRPVVFVDGIASIDVALEEASGPRKKGPGKDPGREPDKGSPPKAKEPSAGKPGKCSGTGAKLSVLAVGHADCKVTVGGDDLGVAPLFKKDAPVGKCEIRVTCPDGKKYRDVRTLSSGKEDKVIIKESDWR